MPNRVILVLMPTYKLTPEILNAAIVGFEQQKVRIDAQIAELRALLDGARTEPGVTPAVPQGKRRKISAAARKRMAEAQRKRWAESRGQSETQSTPATTKPAKAKRKLSAAGRAAIVAALKKRWATKKAAVKKTAPAVAKKSTAKKAAPATAQ